MVLYIHGFNSGPGGKDKEFRKLGVKVHSPQLVNDPKKDLEVLRDIIISNHIEYVVGTSLGGFYAMILAIEFSYLKVHLINPSFSPDTTLSYLIGTKIKNYKTGEESYVSGDFISHLSMIKPNIMHRHIIDRLTFYVGSKDTVLDYESWSQDIIDNGFALKIHVTEQNHRHSDISQVIANIKEDLVLFNEGYTQ